MKLKLALALIISGVCSIGNGQIINSSVLAPASPIMSVISITKFFAEVIGSRVPEYLVVIRVTDHDQEHATKLAFKEACNKALGSVISSELESNNQQLTRDNITNYSSCYVKDHKIISREQNGDGNFTLVIEVTVSSNKIANRALGDSTAIDQLDGSKHVDRVQTYQESKTTEDQLLNSVLQDYPSRAFDIEITGNKTTMDNRRNGRLEITYVAGLNQGYLSSLQDTFKTVGQVPRRNPLDQKPVTIAASQISIYRTSHPYFFDSNKVDYYQFNDLVSYEMIRDRLGSPMNLLIQVRLNSDESGNLSCVSAPFNHPDARPNLISFGYDYQGHINSRNKLQYTIALNVNQQSFNLINRISEIKLVPILGPCPNNLVMTAQYIQ